VDDDAPAGGDGSSWDKAYRFLQDGLDSATAGDEIRVAQGVYKPDRSEMNPEGTRDRRASFELVSGISLVGGYAGLGAADANGRDIEVYKTVLSGDLAGNDVEVTDLSTLRDEPTRKDNAYHVLTITGPAEVEGFIITRGHAFDVGWGHVGYATGNYGGGMYVVLSDASVKDCMFEGNYAEECGGGLGVEFKPGTPDKVYRVQVARCRFRWNAAYLGGAGAAVSHSALDMTDCEISGNWASRDGGGVFAASGATVTMTGCTLVGNRAGAGGGIFVNSGTASLIACRVVQNEAVAGGGGVYLLSEGVFRAESSWFEGNRATGLAPFGSGGGIFLFGREVYVNNCVFSGNTAAQGGASILSGSTDRLDVVDCTFSGNRAPRGNFLWEASGPWDQSVVQISSCVVSNGGNEIWNDHGSIGVQWTDMVGKDLAVNDPCGLVTWGPGNIDVDPCFASPGYWDPNGTPEDYNDDYWVTGDYHLKSQAGRWDPKTQTWLKDPVTSPCIDAGDPNTPVGLEPFPNGGRINMGAYGGMPEASKSWFGKKEKEGKGVRLLN